MGLYHRALRRVLHPPTKHLFRNRNILYLVEFKARYMLAYHIVSSFSLHLSLIYWLQSRITTEICKDKNIIITLTFPLASKRTLSSLISRCRIFFEWQCYNACRIYYKSFIRKIYLLKYIFPIVFFKPSSFANVV